MPKYFVDADGYNCGLVVVENPANPLGYTIVNSVAPPPIRPAVPQIVTRAQFKLALLDLDLLDDVDALVAASNDRALQINWAERLEFERNHPLVIATAAALGKTDAEIDALFVLAASK